MKTRKYCIVTPDTIGPIKNGGIGTHCYYLATLLGRQPSVETTLLFTGPIDSESLEHWQAHYKTLLNVDFVHAQTLPPMFQEAQHGNRGTLSISQRVYQWLKDQEFDIIFFQDWRADGFVSIQAKRTGIAFSRTQLSITLHSPTEWQRQGMNQYPRSEVEMLTEYEERYCMANADFVLSPSGHMFEWAETNSWELARDHRIIPYLFMPPDLDIPQKSFDDKTLVFFGRLETRKGFEVFLSALQLLAPFFRQQRRRLDVHCLGKVAPTRVGDSHEAIDYFLSNERDVYNVAVQSDLSQSEALAFLARNSQALIVAPSLLDNLPFAIIECVELGLNILAGATGGIPELFSNRNRLFEPTPRALAEKLRDVFERGLLPLDKAYSSSKAEELWLGLLKEKAVDQAEPFVSSDNPKVSVCVPHYNYGQFLPELLESLSKQAYDNFEVIIVDDGSDDPDSLAVFESMQKQYGQLGWRFIRNENLGVGVTRNFACSQAIGEFVIFMDADNVASPDMVNVFANAIQHNGFDCLTCYFRAFNSTNAMKSGQFRYCYAPVGACLEGGLNENVFGDTNFIVRKSAYEGVGGMREVRGVAHEDWEFLARFCLSGYKLDTVPQCLFYYRYESESRSRTTNEYRNHENALSPFFNSLPEWASRYILNSIGSRKTGLRGHPHFSMLESKLKERNAQIMKLKQDKQRLKAKLEEQRKQAKRRQLGNRLRRAFGIEKPK